jgi:hypothetical protein
MQGLQAGPGMGRAREKSIPRDYSLSGIRSRKVRAVRKGRGLIQIGWKKVGKGGVYGDIRSPVWFLPSRPRAELGRGR